ncbi:N-acetylmuramoyl-L-alanine amidase [Bacillus sp. TS-2]|nr:N-acetylmuramoyl-L-alanine amidase [Bacillus sp. TS-2]
MSKQPLIKKAGLKFNGSLTPINKNSITKQVQYHMAHKTWDVNQVHEYHLNGNKWSGIGYNWWITFDGTKYEGRAWNVGAHTIGHNSTTLGIGYQGDFTTQAMTEAQVIAGAALNAWLMTQCPNVKSVSVIVGHKDLTLTACPGKNFRMQDLKNTINQLKQESKPTPSKTGVVQTEKPKPQAPTGDSFIRQVQQWIVNYGYRISIDGIAGPETRRALIRVLQAELNRQFKAGLVVDGVYGPKTRAALVTVRHGASGNITRILQAFLYINGLNPGPFDGIFGSGTDKAVRDYQRANRLSMDGVTGRETWTALLR